MNSERKNKIENETRNEMEKIKEKKYSNRKF